MLLIVNAFLLILVLGRENKSAVYETRAREETVAILAKNGIRIDAEDMPKRMELTAMTVPADQEAELHRAEALVGANAVRSPSGVYEGANGATVRFYTDGAFSFLAAPGECPLEGTTPAKAALEYLKKLQFSGRVLELTREEDTGGNVRAVTVTVQLYWEDTPVFTPRKTAVVFRGGELYAIEGYHLSAAPVGEAGGEALSVVTILLELLEHITSNRIVCRAITAVTPGYVLSTAQGTQPRLTPTWHITTDTNPDGYYMDAMTGELL